MAHFNHSHHVPCTVALAPAAVRAPIVPTMKYWKTRLLLAPLLLRYLLKSGILVVGLLPIPLKGESKDDVSLRPVESSARAGSDIDVRGTARSRVREADERAAIAAGAGYVAGQLEVVVDAGGEEVEVVSVAWVKL